MATSEGKIINWQFLKDVAHHGSEPARAAFVGTFPIYSRLPGLEALLAQIPIYPENEREEKMKHFYSQVRADNWYAHDADRRGLHYLLVHSASEMVFYAARLLLAYNRILYPYHKWLMYEVEHAREKPENFLELVETLLNEQNSTNAQVLFECIDSFRDWHVTGSESGGAFYATARVELARPTSASARLVAGHLQSWEPRMARIYEPSDFYPGKLRDLYNAGMWDRLFQVLAEEARGQLQMQQRSSFADSPAPELDRESETATSDQESLVEELRSLPSLWFSTLLRCSLKSLAEQYPAEAFQFMVLLGNEAKALSMAELIGDPMLKTKVQLLIAKTLRETGKAAESMQVLLEIHGTASAISDRWEQAVELQDLAVALAQQEAWAATEDVIAAISEERHQAEARRDFSITLAWKQEWEAAERVMVSIPDEWHQAQARCGLAVALARNRNGKRLNA